MKQIVLFGAHLDDIEIGMGGTLLKLLQDSNKYNIDIHIMCKGRSEKDGNKRKKVFKKNIKNILKYTKNSTINYTLHDFIDLELPYNIKRLNSTISRIMNCYENVYRVYSNSNEDIHYDHKILCDAVIVGTRPNLGNINEVLFYKIPFSTKNEELFNVVIDITKYISIKKDMLNNWKYFLLILLLKKNIAGYKKTH